MRQRQWRRRYAAASPFSTAFRINISTMVFARSRPAMARYDVSSHMVKWWKGHSPMDGQVTKSLSPYEQAVVVPWLKTFPKRAYEKFTDAGMYWLPAGVVTVAIVVATDEADAAQDRSHRY